MSPGRTDRDENACRLRCLLPVRKEVFVLERFEGDPARATLVSTVTTVPEGSLVPVVEGLEEVEAVGQELQTVAPTEN